jgi:hypothetical protein
VAHSIKGASWNLAARRLGDAALAAETAGKNGDALAAETALHDVAEAVAVFTNAIQRYIQ